MSWPWIAYNNGKSATLDFSENRFDFKHRENFIIPEGDDPLLIWDMRGIIKNRPDPSTLPLNPKRTVFVDSGSFYGEDIIDCIMADRGEVILSLRNLNGFDELSIALDFAENLIIGIDYTDSVCAKNKDFSNTSLIDLINRLQNMNINRFLITILGSNPPSLPNSILDNSDFYFAKMDKNITVPYGSKGVFELV